MKYTGEGGKGILFIAEAPGQTEDETGKQLVGKAGQRLRKELYNLGINLDKDCWKINSVNCRPITAEGGNATPTNNQINACRPYLMGIVKDLKPKKIVLLGAVAIEAFYGDRVDDNKINKYAGLKFWDSVHNAWVFPIFHPSYILRKDYDKGLSSYFSRTIKAAIEADDTPLHKQWNPIRPLVDFQEAVKYLSNIIKNHKTVALDWETTGLKSQPEGHKIATVGLANDEGAVAIPVEHPHWTEEQQRKIKFLVANLMKSRKVKKVVHSLGFEYAWAKNILKIEPQGIIFDTQIGVHIEDNRQGITGLKFQAFRRWGVEGYENEVDPFLKAKNGVFNQIFKAPLDLLLQYNAQDALYTWEIYKELQATFDDDDRMAYKVLHEGMLVLAEMHCNGIKIRNQYYIRERKRLEGIRDEVLADIAKLEEMGMFKKKFGRSFDMASNDDMQDMLFDIMKLKPLKQTKTGFSVDEDVLGKIKIPLTEMVLKVRKISKQISTYIDGFMRESFNGIMHPWFYLDRARTYRSSSANPNFQNVPKRDEEAMRTIRSGMVPFLMCLLGEADFSGAEVATSCFYHKDENFIRYQKDKEHADMHKDAASEIWKVDRSLISKPIRQDTKGGFVFAEFYGGYYVDCATLMWETMLDYKLTDGTPLREHVKKVGLNTYAKFEKHVQQFEQKFWDEWFPGYKKWKKEVHEEYIRTGIVKTLLGFKFRGYMDRKQCSNYPVQGTSFHLLLITLVKLYRRIKKEGKLTKLIGQIHDSIVANIVPEELEWFKKTVAEIVRGLDKTFTWMTVPMDVEIDLSDTYEEGGSFARMKKVAI